MTYFQSIQLQPDFYFERIKVIMHLERHNLLDPLYW